MRERHLIALLTTIQFVSMVDFVMMMPLAPLLMHDYQIGAAEFAWMLSAYTFAAAISGLLAGFVMDRFDRRRALLVLLAGFALATLACGLSPSHWWMVVARATAGFFGGVLGALVMAIVADAIPGERRGQALGVIMASFSLASIVGIPLGMILAVGSGWHMSFICLAGVCGAILVWCWAVFPAMTGHIRADRPSPLRVLADVVRVPNHWRAFAMTTALCFAGFTVIPFLSPYLVGNVGLLNDHLKYVYLIGGICSVITSPLIGRLSDRVGAKPMLAIVGLASTAPLLIATHLPQVPLWQALGVTTMFVALVSGRFVPAMALTANAVEPRLRGSFMGFNSAVQSLAMGLAAQLAGWIVVKGADDRIAHYDVVGWIAVGFTVLAVLIGMAMRPAPHVAAASTATATSAATSV